MIEAGIKGSIVNIGSMWAQQAIGATPSSAYSMAKAGLHALTETWPLSWVKKDPRECGVSGRCSHADLKAWPQKTT